MPNHVYCIITTEKTKELQMLHEQSKDLSGGLAQLLMPRPKDQDKDWYEWNLQNWGTKWGFYEQEIDNDTMRFTTAWSLISDELLEKIIEVFPDLHFYYEEEQGWGGEIICDNGKKISDSFYDIPPFGDEGKLGDAYVYCLEEDYEKEGETFTKGWYYDFNLYNKVDEQNVNKITR